MATEMLSTQRTRSARRTHTAEAEGRKGSPVAVFDDRSRTHELLRTGFSSDAVQQGANHPTMFDFVSGWANDIIDPSITGEHSRHALDWDSSCLLLLGP